LLLCEFHLDKDWLENFQKRVPEEFQKKALCLARKLLELVSEGVSFREMVANVGRSI